MKTTLSRKARVQVLILIFMLCLTVSGLTAIPVQWEASLLKHYFGSSSYLGNFLPEISRWFEIIHEGVQNGYGQYPFLAYGTDWLAFGHIVIATAFIGPLRDPVRNIWVIEFGMIACAMVVPWALMFSLIRDIPIFWTLVDMSFGIFGIIPLWFVRREILSWVNITPTHV